MISKQRIRKFLGFGFWVGLLKFLRQASALAVTMVLVRTISKEAFGDYQFVLTMVGVCGIFCLPGMLNVIVQSVARGFPGTFREATKWSWRISFAGSAVLVGLGVWKLFAGDEAIGTALIAAAVVFPQSNGLLNWQSYQTGREQFKITAIYQGASLVVSNGLVIVACLLGYTQIWILIVLFYGVLAIQNVRMTQRILREVGDVEAEPGAIRYGFRTSIYGIANGIGNYLDRILIFSLVSPEMLAVYAVADRIPELFKKNLQSLTIAIIPELSKRKAYTKRLDRQFNVAGIVMSGGVLVAIFFVIPWLIPLLYTSQFEDSVIYCQLLLFSMCLGMFATMKFSYIQAKMDEQGFRGVTLWMSFARIAFSAVLIPIYGALGAAIATVAYRVVTFSVVHFYLQKHRSHDDGGSQGNP